SAPTSAAAASSAGSPAVGRWRRRLETRPGREWRVIEVTRERAERIARSQACVRCLEYSYKKVRVSPASPSHRAELHEVWHVEATCGVCGLQQELGIDAE